MPSGSSHGSFPPRQDPFIIFSVFNIFGSMRFWCSKDIYGGQSKSVLRSLAASMFSPTDSGPCGRELQAQFRSTSGSGMSFRAPSGRSK